MQATCIPPIRTPAQTSPLFQTSGSRSPALRRGCLELDHVFRPSRGPTSRVFIACGPVASCIPPWMCSTQMFGTTVVDATGRDTRKAARVAPRGLFRVLRAFSKFRPGAEIEGRVRSSPPRSQQGARSVAPQGAAPRSGWERAPISFSLITALPYLLEAARARALPGRDAATRNEALRAYQEFVEPG